MDATILNSVLCERVSGRKRLTLHGVGTEWKTPPNSIAIWIEFRNPSEQPFTVSVEVWRGRQFIEYSPTELVLQGKHYWQSWFEWHDLSQFERKTYRFLVMVNGVHVRTMIADLGAPDAK